MVMNLDRKQLSLLITLFSMAIMLLCLYNIQLGKEEKVDEYVVEMMLQEDIAELEKKKEELEKQQKIDPVKSHMAFNDAMEASKGDPEDFKTLEELIEEREAAAENDDPTDLSDSEYAERVKELLKRNAKRPNSF